MKAIRTLGLKKTYWFYEKDAGLAGSIRGLFRGRKVSVEALRGIDLEVGRGEIVGFIGPNGAGKTTTLKILSGILHPTEGEVEVLGFLPFRREKSFLKRLAFLAGQRSRLFWDLPAGEYFNFCKVAYEVPDSLFEKNFTELVEMADIRHILRVPQRKLSFGQRRRCELVAALLHNPEVIFLDEPTNAMDLVNARKIREFIKQRGREQDQTILVTSHIISDIEEVCDRVVIVNEGRIVYDGSLQGLHQAGGYRKQMRVSFAEAPAMDELRILGISAVLTGSELAMDVNADEAASVASFLFSKFRIQDLSIKEMPLEKVIESFYSKGTTDSSCDI
jgi:ABC-2 type transport system ATP-binding protein